MREAVLGIDVGTSGLRILAVGRSNQVLASAAAAMPTPIVDGERKRQDAQIWLNALHEAFAALDLKGLPILALALHRTSGPTFPLGPPFAVFQACVCLPCPCINISLLAAVVPPTAQESKPKPRRLVRGGRE